MSAFHEAVQDFVDAVTSRDHRAVPERANTVLELTAQVEDRDATWALMAFADLLAEPRCPYHGITACLVEPLMRQGGDPWLIVGLLVERFGDTLRTAGEFREELRRRCEAAGIDALAEVRDHGDTWKSLSREQPRESYASSSLELFSLPMPPIVAHFPQARQMLRSDPAAVDQMILLAHEVEGLAEVAHILDQNAGEPVVSQAEDVAEHLANYAEALRLGLGGAREVSAALLELYRALFCVPLVVRNDALRSLAVLIGTADVGFLGELGQFAGSLVETGGEPALALGAIMARLPEVLEQAGGFLDACREGSPPDESDAAAVEQHGKRVGEILVREARAFRAAPALCLGAIGMLSRSVESRKRFGGDRVLIDHAARLARVNGPAGFLVKMLRVLDDETILILDPALERGWRVKVRGIADNFQLHTLLAGALVGPAEEGLIPGLVGIGRAGRHEPERPGRPLDRRAVGVARNLPCTPQDLTVWSKLQLWTWKALQADGTLPDNPITADNSVVWNEGVPADIPAFEGERIVLVGGVSLVRSWNGGRIFHGMKGELTVMETLDADTVRSRLHHLATAPR